MLYIVATPIGNLGEITYRAVEILSKVNYILCEDTRTSKVVLDKYNIKNKCVAYHKFNESKVKAKVILDLKNGMDIALISDAGMPCISDPGNILVNEAISQNIEYTVVSGASALINAFVLSGFKAPFTFVGFLPEKESNKKELLKEISNYKSSLIFYVSPHNLTETIEFLAKTLGNRKCAVVREITKLFEEVTFINLIDGYKGVVKGEFVLVVEGNNNDRNPLLNLTIKQHIKHYMDNGFTKNDAIKQVALERNLKKNEVYMEAVDL